MENIGWRYYIVFCCFLVVILAVTYLFFPETKGYSLEEIAIVFDGPAAELESSYPDDADGKKDSDVVQVEQRA